jgi:hypothetical protein
VLKADAGELLLVSDNLPYMKLCAETLASMMHDGTAVFSVLANGQHRPVSHAPGVFHGTPSGFLAQGHDGSSSYFDRLWERRSKSRFFVAVRLNSVPEAGHENGPQRTVKSKRDMGKHAAHALTEVQRPSASKDIKKDRSVGSGLKLKKTEIMKRKKAVPPSAQKKKRAAIKSKVGSVGRAKIGNR